MKCAQTPLATCSSNGHRLLWLGSNTTPHPLSALIAAGGRKRPSPSTLGKAEKHTPESVLEGIRSQMLVHDKTQTRHVPQSAESCVAVFRCYVRVRPSNPEERRKQGRGGSFAYGFDSLRVEDPDRAVRTHQIRKLPPIPTGSTNLQTVSAQSVINHAQANLQSKSSELGPTKSYKTYGGVRAFRVACSYLP